MPRAKINPFQDNTTNTTPPNPTPRRTPSPQRRRSPSVVPQRPRYDRPRTPSPGNRRRSPTPNVTRPRATAMREAQRRRIYELDPRQVPNLEDIFHDFSLPRRGNRQSRAPTYDPYEARLNQQADWQTRVRRIMNNPTRENLDKLGLKDYKL